jgi:hypothetical protein
MSSANSRGRSDPLAGEPERDGSRAGRNAGLFAYGSVDRGTSTACGPRGDPLRTSVTTTTVAESENRRLHRQCSSMNIVSSKAPPTRGSRLGTDCRGRSDFAFGLTWSNLSARRRTLAVLRLTSLGFSPEEGQRLGPPSTAISHVKPSLEGRTVDLTS